LKSVVASNGMRRPNPPASPHQLSPGSMGTDLSAAKAPGRPKTDAAKETAHTSARTLKWIFIRWHYTPF
jgi:hypothetical protein